MNYLLIADHVVVNVIVLDDPAAYVPPAGYTLEPQSGAVWIGWSNASGDWKPPEPAAE